MINNCKNKKIGEAAGLSDVISPSTEIIVSESGGDFTTIKDALDSINDNGPTKRYVVTVAPGIYVEDNPIQGKQYVSLRASGDLQTTRITANNPNKDLITMTSLFSIEGFTFYGVTGASNYAIRQTVSGLTSLERCAFSECSNGININHASAFMTIINCGFYNAIVTTAKGICCEAGNLTVDILTATNGNITTLINITGVGSVATINNILCFNPNVVTGVFVQDQARVVVNTASIVGVTDGIVTEGGSNTRLNNANIFNCTQDGIRINNVGSSTLVNASGSSEDSTRYDINILSATAIMTGMGKTSLDKMNFVAGAQLYGAVIDTKEDDEGFNVIGELHVGLPEKGAESVFGEGDSYTRGMLVYTETDANVFADVSAAARSASGSTFTFPGVGVDNAIYVGSSLSDGVDYLLHHGMKFSSTIAAVLGGGSIIAEYYNGSAWVEINGMVSDSGIPYLPYAKAYFNQAAGSYQIRYDIVRMNDDTWTKNDPMSLGTSYYWIRFRISSAITTAPTFQQFKLHSSRTEINSDGFKEFFGNARPYDQLPISVGTGKPFEGNMQNQTLYLDQNIGVGLQTNKFTATADKYGWEIIAPNKIDTSSKLAFRWCGLPSASETITWTIRWSWQSPDGTIYTTEPAGGSNPNSKSDTVSKAVTANTLEWFQIYLDVSDLVPRRDTDFPDVMIISIQPSTITGNYSLLGVQAYYLIWGTGGHAD
jgi:hypothetical protein